MKKMLLLIGIVAALGANARQPAKAQKTPDDIMPVRGFCIAAPRAVNLDRFAKFIDEELAPRNINTLILRVDFNYQFESYPNLRDSVALSRADVKKLVSVCRKNNIRIIPQINLLGHQSWAGEIGNLLKEYPEFDETPNIKLPEKYVWPNPDGLYCKSYCPFTLMFTLWFLPLSMRFAMFLKLMPSMREWMRSSTLARDSARGAQAGTRLNCLQGR